MRRFYSPDLDPSSAAVELDPEQSAHARTVLRLKAGDEVSVFDGRGGEFLCTVVSVGKKRTELSVISSADPPAPESSLDLTLAVALLKHDRFDLVVQKAVELGVTRLVPVVTARCDVPAKAAEKRIARWERIAVEASKQCGRAVLMEILEPVDIAAFIGDASGERIMFSERDGGRLPALKDVSEMTILTGPEGGWEDDEISQAKQTGFSIVTLGGRVLRAETAAIAAAVLAQKTFGDLDGEA